MPKKRRTVNRTERHKLKLRSLEVHYLRFSLNNSPLLFFIAKIILKEKNIIPTESQYMLNKYICTTCELFITAYMYRLLENKREGNNQEGQCTVYTHKHSYWLTAMFYPLGERFFNFILTFHCYYCYSLLCLSFKSLTILLLQEKESIYLEFYKRKKRKYEYPLFLIRKALKVYVVSSGHITMYRCDLILCKTL